jgi:hypothetical protein
MPSLIPRPGTEVRFTPIPRFHTIGISDSILNFLLVLSAICLFDIRYRLARLYRQPYLFGVLAFI